MQKCPYCKLDTISNFKKITMNSKRGIICDNCGERLTLSKHSKWVFAVWFISNLYMFFTFEEPTLFRFYGFSSLALLGVILWFVPLVKE